jgi:hypothetical protein
MKFGPEGRMLSPTETRLSEPQEALYPLLVPENERRAIDMNAFRDLYDVDKDMEYLRRKEAKNAERDARENNPEKIRTKKSGKLFEAVVNHGIDEIGFLGPDASSTVASQYDDFHGIDSIVEFESEEGMTSHLALGIDVTRNARDIKEKLDNVRKDISNGKLSDAKYFKSPNFRGELRNIVRVVVGADQFTIDNISDLIVRKMRLNKTIEENKKSENSSESTKQLTKERGRVSTALGEHPLQWIVLFEILQELEAYQRYAEKMQKPNIVKECGKILGIINQVIADKKDVGLSPNEEALSSDRVYQLIREEIKSF